MIGLFQSAAINAIAAIVSAVVAAVVIVINGHAGRCCAD